eukprot:gene7469-8298_t
MSTESDSESGSKTAPGPGNILDIPEQERLLRRGEETLKKYQSRASECWTEAVSNLASTCSEMTSIEQSILAMKFANCHFEKSGLPTYDCTSVESFRSCSNLMKKDDPTSYLVYTEFYTHVSDVCFYLQSDIWRKRTSETISKLSYTAEETVQKLEKSLTNQETVLDAQNKSLQNQISILKHEENLKQALQNSTASATIAFEEMKQRADEQKAIFSSTFDGIFAGVDKLAELQSMLLGEFIGLQSIAFYFITIITCYLLTSAPSTAGARLILFIMFILLVFLEKIIVKRQLQSQDVSPGSNEALHASIWNVRKIFIAISLFILGYVASMYKDLNSVNNKLLREIQAQVLAIQNLEKAKQLKITVSNKSPENRKYLQDHNDTTSPSSIPTVSTPHAKSNSFSTFLEMFTRSPLTPKDHVEGPSEVESVKRDLLFSDEDDPAPKVKSKKKSNVFSKKNFLKGQQKTSKNFSTTNKQSREENQSKILETSVSSRYNLRRRSATPLNSPVTSFLSDVSSTPGRRSAKKCRKKITSPPNKTTRPFFSSDEED